MVQIGIYHRKIFNPSYTFVSGGCLIRPYALTSGFGKIFGKVPAVPNPWVRTDEHKVEKNG
jgi:hypothetical protein